MSATHSITFRLDGFCEHCHTMPGPGYFFGSPQWLTELDDGLEDIGQVSFAKVVLTADSEEHLLKVEAEAKAAGLTTHRVVDSGYSHNKPSTLACIAIGPHWPEQLQPVTGSLKLYR